MKRMDSRPAGGETPRTERGMPHMSGAERSAMAKAETGRALHRKAEASVGGCVKVGEVAGHKQATHVMEGHMAVPATKRRPNAEPPMTRVKQHTPGAPMKYMHRDMEERVAAHRPMNRSKD